MRKLLLGAAFLGCVLLGGCASVCNLTTEESDLIAEYAANVLCKVSYENKENYLALKKHLYVPETPTFSKPEQGTTEVETKNPNANVEIIDPKEEDVTNAGSGAAISNIAEVLGIKNVKVTCLGYDVTDTYPEDEFALSVSAKPGNKLIVVSYNLMNLTSENVIMHVEPKLSVKAIINESSSVPLLATLLNDDIMNMEGKELTSGETVTGVFLFQVKEDMCDNIASLNVEAKRK